ncbi:ubiquinone anaerobic biosynthesis protein UbiU [Paraburkholderia caballeronis]|uniref:Ubiquinone biosynthesis protein UbiU n=1 Tax=Paraburkholderia caballeronis TaxID=416943 RepID=A0A1H7FWW3_9BURK|nr:peptidase U32 family protein [Paraburkholderia caballeronis]PXW24830.1 putative protease [Paraburkholderia caballeronis]PXX00560.1 putative protease [Paraburkholderia caballeronis]RAJ98623.1 putative protease [Paraburkholderia caballeronis]SEE68412.1 putative protease [Paraburkholderia caballeronis]SEK29747.1 putative protease [Paraburkholderia caballeronis]
MSDLKIPELVCPAGSPPALRAAVDGGADCIYVGLKNDTNARAFPGLNFDERALGDGVQYAHRAGAKVLLAINTYAHGGDLSRWTNAIDIAARVGVDAIIVADVVLMAYAARVHPSLRLHLSVQASVTSYEGINFLAREFGIRRAVLPRVLSVEQIENTIAHTAVEIEVFGFGSLCVMVEGRCALSAHASGEAPNLSGVCSPARHVQWIERIDAGRRRLDAKLGPVLVDSYDPDERASYPTICKGRFDAGGKRYYTMEEPASLNALELLPTLARIGVAAVKVEGRQRGPAYTAAVTRVWRAALDALAQRGDAMQPQAAWLATLAGLSEGQQDTLGAYSRPWK